MTTHVALFIAGNQALTSDIGHRLYTEYTILYPIQYAVACIGLTATALTKTQELYSRRVKLSVKHMLYFSCSISSVLVAFTVLFSAKHKTKRKSGRPQCAER